VAALLANFWSANDAAHAGNATVLYGVRERTHPFENMSLNSAEKLG